MSRSSLANPEISVKRCLVSKNIMKILLVLFGPKNITFGNILTQKYRTYLPVCACTECPPGIYTVPRGKFSTKNCVYRSVYVGALELVQRKQRITLVIKFIFWLHFSNKDLASSWTSREICNNAKLLSTEVFIGGSFHVTSNFLSTILKVPLF